MCLWESCFRMSISDLRLSSNLEVRIDRETAFTATAWCVVYVPSSVRWLEQRPCTCLMVSLIHSGKGALADLLADHIRLNLVVLRTTGTIPFG